MGANYENALKSIRSKLNLNTAPIQIPIGQDNDFIGIICLVS